MFFQKSLIFCASGSTQAEFYVFSKNSETIKYMKTYGGQADAFSGSGQAFNGFGGIATGVTGIISAGHTNAAKEAQIEQTKQDAVLEILKKMQNDGSEQTKQLMDFIARILSMIQELQQTAAQTEKTIVQA